MANILGAPVDRPPVLETTALGVAWLAGMHCDLYPDQQEIAKNYIVGKQFKPQMGSKERNDLYLGWGNAVRSTLSLSRS